MEGKKQLTSQSEVNKSYYKPALQKFPSYLPFGGRKDTLSHGSFLSNYNLLNSVIFFDQNISKVFKTKLVELAHLLEIWNKGREFSPGLERRDQWTLDPQLSSWKGLADITEHKQLPRDFLKRYCCYINIKSKQWIPAYFLKKSLSTLTGKLQELEETEFSGKKSVQWK